MRRTLCNTCRKALPRSLAQNLMALSMHPSSTARATAAGRRTVRVPVRGEPWEGSRGGQESVSSVAALGAGVAAHPKVRAATATRHHRTILFWSFFSFFFPAHNMIQDLLFRRVASVVTRDRSSDLSYPRFYDICVSYCRVERFFFSCAAV